MQLCVLLEEGFCTHLMEIDVESRRWKEELGLDNEVDEKSVGFVTMQRLLKRNMERSQNQFATKKVTTHQMSDQHLSINSKVIMQMFTKLTAKGNQLSRQMKFM